VGAPARSRGLEAGHEALARGAWEFARKAFERALSCGLPAVLELRLPEEVITPNTTLSAIREQALKHRGAAKDE